MVSLLTVSSVDLGRCRSANKKSEHKKELIFAARIIYYCTLLFVIFSTLVSFYLVIYIPEFRFVYLLLLSFSFS